jgi:DnaJ-class molecular chaperone
MRWFDVRSGYTSRIEVLSAMQPHERLGVAQEAPHEEVKAAYLRLAKAYHPDVADPFMAQYHQEVMKLMNEAYELLRDRP